MPSWRSSRGGWPRSIPAGTHFFGDELVSRPHIPISRSPTDPTTGNYNQFWNSDRDIDNRTSLITDPPDGRIPPLTPEAELTQKNSAGSPA